MKVRALVSRKVSFGKRTWELEAGKIYDLPDAVANKTIEQKVCKAEPTAGPATEVLPESEVGGGGVDVGDFIDKARAGGSVWIRTSELKEGDELEVLDSGEVDTETFDRSDSRGVTTGLAMVPAAGMAAGIAVRSGAGLRGTLGATVRGMGTGALAGGPAKEPFGAVSAGIGAGRTGATERYLAGRMGLKDDIQKTTDTFIHGKGMGEKMENFEVARADLAKDPVAYRDAVKSGDELTGSVDKWGDKEAYDAYGRADMGPKYDPKVHRKIYQASDLKPYEIKQGAKLAHSKIVGNSRYGEDGANLAMKFIHDGKVDEGIVHPT